MTHIVCNTCYQKDLFILGPLVAIAFQQAISKSPNNNTTLFFVLIIEFNAAINYTAKSFQVAYPDKKLQFSKSKSKYYSYPHDVNKRQNSPTEVELDRYLIFIVELMTCNLDMAELWSFI